MNRLTKFFMMRPTLFWSLMVGILVAGVLSFLNMPKLEDPAVPVKQAMVVIPYPGASAHEVELKVVQPVEDALRTMPDIFKIKSDCQSGMAVITVEYELNQWLQAKSNMIEALTQYKIYQTDYLRTTGHLE